MCPQNLPLPEITRFESCDSTNRLLLEAAERGAPAGSVYVARQQLAGRGRRGRSWLAAPDLSLTFSLLWTFPADPARLQGLPLLVGLAVMHAFSDARLGETRSGLRCGLKWPNDLLLERSDGVYAKLGGILVESTVRPAPHGGRELAVIIGIGLNCGENASLQAAVTDQSVGTLSELFREPVTPDLLLPCVLDRLFDMLADFVTRGFAPFAQAWNAHDLWHQLPVQISEDGIVRITGRCLGVDPDGVLCVETDAGIERILSGDVSLRRQ